MNPEIHLLNLFEEEESFAYNLVGDQNCTFNEDPQRAGELELASSFQFRRATDKS